MSNVIHMKEYRDRRIEAPRGTTPRGFKEGMTEADREARVRHTRQGLINYLTARRERLGMTSLDVKQSPEQVEANELEKKKNMRLLVAQQDLVDDYLQSQDSVNTM